MNGVSFSGGVVGGWSGSMLALNSLRRGIFQSRSGLRLLSRSVHATALRNHLRNLPTRQRGDALIEIAASAFREELRIDIV